VSGYRNQLIDISDCPNYQNMVYGTNIKVGITQIGSRVNSTGGSHYTNTISVSYESSTGILTVTFYVQNASEGAMAGFVAVNPNGFE
jgi:hypothetical protein